MGPTTPVRATCVPPSACKSRPTISATRTGSTPSGSRLILVRIRSAIANASAAGEEADAYLTVGRHLGVDAALDLDDEIAGQSFQLEILVGPAGFERAAGDRRATVAPDDPAQSVRRGMGPHQGVTACSIGRAVHARAHRGRSTLELMAHLVAVLAADLAHIHDVRLGAFPQQQTMIGELSPTLRVKDGVVEGDAIGLDARHDCVYLTQVAVSVIRLIPVHTATPSSFRACPRVPRQVAAEPRAPGRRGPPC